MCTYSRVLEHTAELSQHGTHHPQPSASGAKDQQHRLQRIKIFLNDGPLFLFLRCACRPPRTPEILPCLMHDCALLQLEDAKHKMIYDLGARTSGERASWVETLTKASRFSKGAGEEQRESSLSRRFLITKRPESRKSRGLGGDGRGVWRWDSGEQGRRKELTEARKNR